MEKLFIIFCTLILVLQASGQTITGVLPTGYNTKQSPNISGITNVNISVTVNSLMAVTESSSNFQLDMTLYLKWFDTRLNASAITASKNNNEINDLILGSSFITQFWIPDIYFQNGQSASIISSGQTAQYLALGVYQNVTYMARYSATFVCKMDLSHYPEDYQYCSIDATSLTQTSAQLVLNWEPDGFDAGNGNSPKFIIRATSLSDCHREVLGQSYSCKRATMKLVRRVSFYIIRQYGPTFLQVVVTYVGFWIPPAGYPARVAVVVTPLLSLITLDINSSNDIGVYYVVDIHWWMMWCELFIYLALIEYAVALSWSHFANEKKAFKASAPTDQNGNQMAFGVKGHYFGNDGWWAKSGQNIDKIIYFFFGNVDFFKDPMIRNKVDYASRILFPILWLLFVLIYILATIVPWAANYN